MVKLNRPKSVDDLLMLFIRNICFLSIAMFLIAGCQSENQQETEETSLSDIEMFVKNSERVAGDPIKDIDLTAHIKTHQTYSFDSFHLGSSNLVFSPFDQQLILAMVSLGASGSTLESMSSHTGIDASNEYSYSVINSWEQHIAASNSIERKTSLWGQTDYLFSTDYLQAQIDWFSPEITATDFFNQPWRAESEINYWFDDILRVSEITFESRIAHGTLTNINNYWSTDAIQIESFQGKFWSLDHSAPIWTNMIKLSGMLNTTSNEDFQAYEIPLSDPDISLIMIVPEDGRYEAVIQQLNADIFQNILANFTLEETSVVLPTFELTTDFWPQYAPDLGIATTENADFSRVNGMGYLFLNSLQQRIHFNVNESGVTSKTATIAITNATKDEPDELRNSPIDAGVIITAPNTETPCFYPPDQRAFIFSILEKESGAILQLGRVSELLGEQVSPDWLVSRWASCGDSPPMWISRYAGGVNCEYEEISQPQMQRELIEAGIEIIDQTIHHPISVDCGEPSEQLYSFKIPSSKIETATALGFFVNDPLLY